LQRDQAIPAQAIVVALVDIGPLLCRQPDTEALAFGDSARFAGKWFFTPGATLFFMVTHTQPVLNKGYACCRILCLH